MNLARRFGALAAAPIILLAACGGDDVLEPAPASPTPGGGTTGGTIAQKLTVFVEEEATNKPLAGAIIVVESGALRLEGKTNAEGRIDLNDPELKGPIALHVFHDSFSARSLIGFDAALITVPLAERVGPFVAIATAEGSVSGWEQMGPLNVASAQVAFLSAAGRDYPASVAQVVRPGTISRSNPRGIHGDVLLRGNEMFPTFERFTLNFDARATAIVAHAGVLTVDPFGPPLMELTHFGFVDGVTSGSTLAALEIPLTHTIDHSVRVLLSGAPSLPVVEGLLAVELPLNKERVIFSSNGAVASNTWTGKVPVLSGSLSGGAYLASAIVSSKAEAGALPAEEASAIARGDGPQITIGGFIAPPGRPSIGGRTIASSPSSGATQHEYTLLRGDQIAWSILIAGDAVGSVVLPSIPEGALDPREGATRVESRAVVMPGVNLDEVKFVELNDQVTATAIHRAQL